jgi:hypothetical protein
MDIPPSTICNNECWKWGFHFIVVDGWDNIEVLVLDWMQVMSHGNVGFRFSIWLSVESLQDITINGIPTFGVFV